MCRYFRSRSLRVCMDCDICHLGLMTRQWFVIFRIHLQLFDFIKCLPAVDDLAKHCVLQVQAWLGAVRDEKLRGVGVWPGVGHRDHASRLVLQVFSDLICELATPDAVAALPRVGGITRLQHERLYVSHKDSIVIIICATQSEEIFTSFRSLTNKQLYFEITVGRVQGHCHPSE